MRTVKKRTHLSSLWNLLLTAWPSLSRDGLPLPSDAVWGLCCTLHAVTHFFIFWWQCDPQSQQIWAWNITVPVKGGETCLRLFLLFCFLTKSWKEWLQLLRVAAFWLYLSIWVNKEVLKRLELVLGRSSSWAFRDGKFGWSAWVPCVWERDLTRSLSYRLCKGCGGRQGSAGASARFPWEQTAPCAADHPAVEEGRESASEKRIGFYGNK